MEAHFCRCRASLRFAVDAPPPCASCPLCGTQYGVPDPPEPHDYQTRDRITGQRLVRERVCQRCRWIEPVAVLAEIPVQDESV